MNQLVVTGTQEFMGKEIKIIEGGFGDNQRVLTDNMIGTIHNVAAREIRRLIKDNIKRFKENIDFIDLKKGVGSTHTLDLTQFGYSKQAITQAEHLYLLSERGYAKIIKIMDTDLAWDIHDKLIDEYFTMRQVIKETYSYMIEDPIERAKKWIEEQEKNKALIAEKEKQLTKANTKVDKLKNTVTDLVQKENESAYIEEVKLLVSDRAKPGTEIYSKLFKAIYNDFKKNTGLDVYKKQQEKGFKSKSLIYIAVVIFHKGADLYNSTKTILALYDLGVLDFDDDTDLIDYKPE